MNSVFRNKIKRLIRENYRLLEDNIKTGNCLVILWKKNIKKEEANFKQIKEDMENILKRANIFEEKVDI